MTTMNTFRFVLCALTAAALPAFAEEPTAIPYAWKSVPIVGGGFVDGLVFHPTAKDVLYARTDMGGAYRRNPKTRLWEPMLDFLPYADLNLMGVESLAVDPSDAQKVYLACGTYTAPDVPNGAILRSSDQGHTFQRSNVPFKFGGNEAGRGNGERMAVDPNDGRILFLGTRKNGLWKSEDGAVTWTKVESFPKDVLQLSPEEEKLPAWSGGGRNTVVFVVFDPSSGSKGKPSQTIYAGVSIMGKPGIFRSEDAGKTWKVVPGAPTEYRPNHAVAGLRRHSVHYLWHRSRPHADDGRRAVEARHQDRHLDGYHARQARPGTQVRLRRRVGGRQRSEGSHRQLILSSQGRGGFPQHRWRRLVEAGV